MFLFDEEAQNQKAARIKVIGVGGGGSNAINNMINRDVEGVDFITANTDSQALNMAKSQRMIQLGTKLTRGLGAGGRPQIGRESALETIDLIREMLSETDMLFVTAGMGGGTGTGAAPVIANIAKEMGILTVGVVTKPFDFEGPKRMRQAEEGISELKKGCHSVIIIPNQRLLSVVEKGTPLTEAFLVVDDVLRQAVDGISSLITTPGLMNVDFADVRAVMSHMGRSVMGMGVATGENRAIEAAQIAISSPLLEESSIEGARGVLLNVTGGPDLSLHEVNDASSIIQKAVDPDANIIFGSVISEQMGDEVRVTVIATGFEEIEAVKIPEKEVHIPMINPPKNGRESGIKIREVVREELGREDFRQKDLRREEHREEVRGKLEGIRQSGTLFPEEEWDIPTFIRNQAD